MFLAIREHKIGNPQINRISEIEGLLPQIQNINDIDFNDNGNTPLHVAVSKGYQDIVEVLLKEQSIDINIKNNIGKAPLDIATESNKEDIAKALKTPKVSAEQESLVNHPQPGSSSQVGKLNPRQQSTAGTEVNGRLEKFVEYFVKEFEAKLHAYYMILEGEVKKSGKFSSTFSGKAGKGIGGAIGGGLGLLLMPFVGPAALGGGVTGGVALGEEGARALGDKLGEIYHRDKVIILSALVYYTQKNKADVRKILVKAGFDIFQSFEMQFMRVTTDQGHEGAMRKLAEDATNRAISYFQKKEDGSITEGVVLGKSKIEPILGAIPVSTSKLKTPGFKIQYQYLSSENEE